MDILDLLRSDGSIVINKKLAHKIGLNASVVLSELIARFKYHDSKGQAEGGWFYCTKNTLEEQTSLNRYYQDKAIEELEELGLITKKTKGIPAKRYFKIHEKSILTLVTSKIVKDSQTSSSNSRKQDSESLTNKSVKDSQEVILNNNTNNNTNNNKDIVEQEEKEKIPYSEIIDYLNQRIGTNYRSTTKKTRKLIRARWNEGFRLIDFKTVIEKKAMEWLGDKRMEKYLRPVTLFSNKFESYLNQISVNNEGDNSKLKQLKELYAEAELEDMQGNAGDYQAL